MIVTTTPTIEGHNIKEYKGVVSGEVIFGMNFLKDFGASLRDFFGGRTDSYEKAMLEGRETAQKELLPLTGYIRGGCCPIGMKRPFPTYIDETCLLHEKIYVSAGQRGMQLRLAPQDLINYVPLEVSDLI